MTTVSMPVGTPPTATIKHRARKSTLSRKREDDDLLVPSSPSKRSKVSFDSDVEVRLVEEWEKTPTVIQEAVRRALLKRSAGDNTGYDQIKAVYTPVKDNQEETSSATLRNYTFALLNNVSMLNKSCADLVHAALASDWLSRSEGYVHLFTQFLANLVSAQTLYLPDVLRMLVENMTAGRLSLWRPVGRTLADLKRKSSTIAESIRRPSRRPTLADLPPGSQGHTVSSADRPFSLPHSPLYPYQHVSSSDRLEARPHRLRSQPSPYHRVCSGSSGGRSYLDH